MRIDILGWQSSGLRCPNMEINLISGDNLPQISLIQMPNGTAKTTTLTMIRAAMNGDAEKWNHDEVMSFRRVGETNSDGCFILKLSIDRKPLTFELNFNFDEGKVVFSTSSQSLGGITPGWHPPDSLRRFFESKFVRLFIFDGELAQDLFNPEKTEASQAIDTLFQLYLLKEIEQIAERNWEQATKYQSSTPQGQTRQLNKIKEFKKHIETVKQKLESKKKRLSVIEAEIEKLESKIGDHQSADRELQEQLDETKLQVTKAEKEIELLATEIMNQIRQPQLLHQSFSNSLIELKSKLDKAKLPEKASRQFFIDIAEQPKCICGRDLCSETRQEIKKRADLYLSDHTSAFLNALKEDIRNNLSYDEDRPIYPINNQIDVLNKNIFEKTRLKNKCDYLQQKIIERGDDDLKELNKSLDEYKIEKAQLEKTIQAITRPSSYKDDPQMYKKVYCLASLEKWLQEEEGKLAEISGTVEKLHKKEIFQKILKLSLKKANNNLKELIIKTCNHRLSEILYRDPIQIDKIEHSLKLEGQKSGSVGQLLSAGYTFLTTLLDRGKNQFPLLVDSPANGLDGASRREIGKLIPKLCHQFIAFTISTEREGFTNILNENSDSTKFITVFRKTKGTSHLLESLPSQGVTTSDNCVIVEGKDYFDLFDIEEDKE
ncbi:MAG: hypothetical protein Tsb0014_07610 [Pleurocapsa sp.]